MQRGGRYPSPCDYRDSVSFLSRAGRSPALLSARSSRTPCLNGSKAIAKRRMEGSADGGNPSRVLGGTGPSQFSKKTDASGQWTPARPRAGRKQPQCDAKSAFPRGSILKPARRHQRRTPTSPCRRERRAALTLILPEYLNDGNGPD